MTASAPRRVGAATARAPAAALALAALALAACQTPSAPPTRSPLEPLPRLGARMPDEVDRAAHDVAAALLADDRERLERNMARVEALEAARREAGQPPAGLLPYALDARNATEADTLARRRASAALLERGDVPPALRARVEEEVKDDELRLASERLRDAQVRRWGRRVNALMEPVGRSVANTALLPYRLAQGLLDTWLSERADDALTQPERQALDHWKRFIEQHPDAPESAALLDQVERAQFRWMRTQRDRQLRAARNARDAGDPTLAAALAKRALRYAPEDADATRLLREAQARAAEAEARRARSVGAAAAPRAVDPAQRALAVALLEPAGAARGRVDAAAAALLEAPDALFADEAGFALALAEAERGAEAEAWRELDALAGRGDEASPMARHAKALVSSPVENPYRAFRAARRGMTAKKARWLAFGPLVDGARDRDLPRPVEWLVEVPTLVPVVAGLPNRLIRLPFLRAEWSVPSVLARRYLERFPDGLHAAEVRSWLVDFEADRGNHVGALKLAEAAPAAEPGALAELRRDAAEQALGVSRKERRRDVRQQLLRQVAQDFRDTEAGRRAGELLREELLRTSPQQIRVSRGFLVEQPRVAGPEGLGLRPELLDGKPWNGELHPDGVTLLGARVIELAFLAPSGRAGDEPERVRQRISEERLARIVAQLEEAALRMARLDPDAPFEADADRDVFFERVRLGLVDEPDLRPGAESSYAFRGVRERYGLVRSRESILPVEIVLQGSFDDFGLGAFPRIRMPKPTPDAFLYR